MCRRSEIGAGKWRRGIRVDRLKSIVLRDQSDADGERHLGAEWRDEGGILIEGQDLGPGV